MFEQNRKPLIKITCKFANMRYRDVNANKLMSNIIIFPVIWSKGIKRGFQVTGVLGKRNILPRDANLYSSTRVDWHCSIYWLQYSASEKGVFWHSALLFSRFWVLSSCLKLFWELNSRVGIIRAFHNDLEVLLWKHWDTITSQRYSSN